MVIWLSDPPQIETTAMQPFYRHAWMQCPSILLQTQVLGLVGRYFESAQYGLGNDSKQLSTGTGISSSRVDDEPIQITPETTNMLIRESLSSALVLLGSRTCLHKKRNTFGLWISPVWTNFLSQYNKLVWLLSCWWESSQFFSVKTPPKLPSFRNHCSKLFPSRSDPPPLPL